MVLQMVRLMELALEHRVILKDLLVVKQLKVTIAIILHQRLMVVTHLINIVFLTGNSLVILKNRMIMTLRILPKTIGKTTEISLHLWTIMNKIMVA